jgi:hypothetical protein
VFRGDFGIVHAFGSGSRPIRKLFYIDGWSRDAAGDVSSIYVSGFVGNARESVAAICSTIESAKALGH